MTEPCYFCEQTDEPTFPTFIPECNLEDHLEWICRRHLWLGFTVIHAFTGMPIVMAGREEDHIHWAKRNV